MTFIRIKNIKAKNGTMYPYYYLVESIWTDKGARQKVIAYLGRAQNLSDITKNMIIEIFAKSNNLCAECKQPSSVGNQLTIDHITPLSKGGTNESSNLQALCFVCNQKKTDSMVLIPSDQRTVLA